MSPYCGLEAGSSLCWQRLRISCTIGLMNRSCCSSVKCFLTSKIWIMVFFSSSVWSFAISLNCASIAGISGSGWSNISANANLFRSIWTERESLHRQYSLSGVCIASFCQAFNLISSERQQERLHDAALEGCPWRWGCDFSGVKYLTAKKATPIPMRSVSKSINLALRYFVWVIFVSNIDTLYSYTSILEPKTVG